MGWVVGREPVAGAMEMMEVWGAEVCEEYAVLMQSHRNEGGALGSPWLSQVLQSPRRAASRDDDHPGRERQAAAHRKRGWKGSLEEKSGESRLTDPMISRGKMGHGSLWHMSDGQQTWLRDVTPDPSRRKGSFVRAQL